MIPPLSSLDLRGVTDTLRRWMAGLDAWVRSMGTASRLNADADVALAGNSDQVLPTQKAVKAYADAITAAVGAGYQPLDADLTAAAGLTTTGLVTRTGAGTMATRTLTGPAAGFTITDGNGVSGNPTFVLADDLAAVEGLSGTGMASRTAANTWALRQIAGTANEIGVTDGTGAAGNPTISLPTNITLTGKNITGGTITGITDLAVADGGTGASDAAGARTNLGLGSAATYAASNADAATSIPLRDASGYLSQRVIRNTTGPATDGMYIGYGNAGSGATRLFGGGDTTKPVYVTTGGNLNIPGGINFENATSNFAVWNIAGVAPPTHTTRSDGTKLVLYPALSGSAVDDAVGIESGAMWLSVADSTRAFKWYAGTTAVAELSGTGALRLIGSTAIASLGSATQGAIKYCSDLGGGAGLVAANGSNWRRLSKSGQTTVSSDADFTLTTLSSAEEIRHTGTLTADRTVTLSTTNAHSGARFRVSRTVSSSLYVLHIGALCDLPALSWCEVIYDGSAWYVAASGTLP